MSLGFRVGARAGSSGWRRGFGDVGHPSGMASSLRTSRRLWQGQRPDPTGVRLWNWIGPSALRSSCCPVPGPLAQAGMTRAVGAPQNLCVMISRNHVEETSRRERKGRKGRRSNRTFAELPSLTSLTAEQICLPCFTSRPWRSLRESPLHSTESRRIRVWLSLVTPSTSSP